MNIRDEIAASIRRVDGSNTLEPKTLAAFITDTIVKCGHDVHEHRVVDIVERVNPGKTMGASALADMIVGDLGLDD